MAEFHEPLDREPTARQPVNVAMFRAWAVAVSLTVFTVIACSSVEEAAPDTGDDLEPDAAAPEPDAAPPKPPPPPVDAGPKTCQDQLRALGVAFTTTTARGVVDAVKLGGPIGGVTFTREMSTDTTGDPMACSFALRLVDFAKLLAEKGVKSVGTLGAYCYRCCCAWSQTNQCRDEDDPEPDCGSNGFSNHSFGRALDVRWVTKTDGTRLDINDVATWVKTASSGTCTTGLAAQKGNSKFLYEIACAAHDREIFKTVLTPNYNAAHRNHWHMDVGEKDDEGGSSIIKSLPRVAVDVATDVGRCGDE